MSSNIGNNIVKQKIKIYTIHSQKGGAGKTSIAIAIAGLSCILHKQKTLIIDCDLTGTSIIDLFYDVDKNNKAKEKVRYFNNLLLATPLVFENMSKNNIEKEYFHRISDYNDLYYIPSSPILQDIREIAGLISQENELHYFQSRMEDILRLFVSREIKTIIIDCPPGLFGLSSAMLQISTQDEFDIRHLLITSSDRSDYRALIPSCCGDFLNRQIDDFKFIFNKCSIKHRDSAFSLREIFKDLERKGTFPDNRKIKKTNKVYKKIKNSSKKHGSSILPFIADFDILHILFAIQALGEGKGETSFDSMQKWCHGIKELLDL